MMCQKLQFDITFFFAFFLIFGPPAVQHHSNSDIVRQGQAFLPCMSTARRLSHSNLRASSHSHNAEMKSHASSRPSTTHSAFDNLYATLHVTDPSYDFFIGSHGRQPATSSHMHEFSSSSRALATDARDSASGSSASSISDEEGGIDAQDDMLHKGSSRSVHGPVQSTPRPFHKAQRGTEDPDASFLDRLMTGNESSASTAQPKRKRGRPRKEASLTPQLPATVAKYKSESPDQPKRKRGRPRKRELEPHEEIALIAFKQSGSIRPWKIIAPVDRPPQYPETHVFFRMPQTKRRPPLLDSPEAPRAPPSKWWHYTRPILKDVPARRPDGQTSEPLPLAPPGRRPRTRVDYAGLQHLQLANRARGVQLNVQALWERRVTKTKRNEPESTITPPT